MQLYTNVDRFSLILATFNALATIRNPAISRDAVLAALFAVGALATLVARAALLAWPEAYCRTRAPHMTAQRVYRSLIGVVREGFERRWFGLLVMRQLRL